MSTTAAFTTGDRNAVEPVQSPQKLPLGQQLLQRGLVSEQQLDLALREQRHHGKLLGEVLIDLGFVEPGVITDLLATEAGAEMVDVLTTSVDLSVLDLVDYETAMRYTLIPLRFEEGALVVALADAFDVVVIDQLEKSTGYPVRVVSAHESDIREALALHYAQGSSINETVDRILRDGNVIGSDAEDAGQGTPLVKLVDQIISLGIKRKATDIHIEPDERILRVRMRVDGILHQEVLIPKSIQPPLIARLKLIGGLDITEQRSPQDGRIKFANGQSDVDLRISTLPTSHGESVVLRILSTIGKNLSLKNLGFSTTDHERFSRVMDQPYGMVLVTGPTGSGKTTTLYTALSQIDAEARSVFTLEDPIEYSMSLIRQTQIRPEVGMDFSNGLRALLRQDPDVILVGEIRDVETAQLATRAALTGHLVLSTLHTNTAVGVIPRLIDMGVERYLLPSALSAVIGQRLVRKLCTSCRIPVDDPRAELDKLEFDVPEGDTGSVTLWRAEGCDVCRQTGYQGRLAIYEVLTLNESFHEAIVNGAPSHELEAVAKTGGMKTMAEDGLAKAFEGLTTVDEIIRTVR